MLNWIDENQHPRPFGLSSPNGRIEGGAPAMALPPIRCESKRTDEKFQMRNA